MDVVENAATKPRRIKRRGRHPDKALSAAFVRSAPPGRYADGNGLYLYVQKTGTRSWIQRLVIRGRKRELGLGSVQRGLHEGCRAGVRRCDPAEDGDKIGTLGKLIVYLDSKLD